jgi:hypothetical protein
MAIPDVSSGSLLIQTSPATVGDEPTCVSAGDTITTADLPVTFWNAFDRNPMGELSSWSGCVVPPGV